MNVRAHTRVSEFLDVAGSRLEMCEAENSLILGLARTVASTPDRYGSEPYLITLTDGEELVLAAFMTPPFPLVLAGASDSASLGIPCLIEHLVQAHPSISGVTANRDLADTFAAQWSEATAQPIVEEMHQRIYQLTAMNDVSLAPGCLRLAEVTDGGIVGSWYADFQEEASHDMNRAGATKDAYARIDRGELYVWEDGVPRSMAGRSRPTRNTITVNGVYTPPEFRRTGFATSAVATLSALLLEEGYRGCVLYTDLANPTSNAIYQRIGYSPVCDSARFRFGPCPDV